MKIFITTAAACLLLLPGAGVASAQTRSRRTTNQRASAQKAAPKRRGGSGSTSRLSTTEANTARVRVADQIKNLNRFLYLYGRASKDIEATSAQAESAEVARRSRASLLASIRNVREGLDQLEADFRLTPGLQNFYPSLRGVAGRAAEAENLAANNQLDQAGRALIEVVSQLTDVLLEME